MVAAPAVGLALCVNLAKTDAISAAKAATLAAAAASAAWIAVPSGRRPWVAKALEAPPKVWAPRGVTRSGESCPLGYGVDKDPKAYKEYDVVLRSISSTFDIWNLIKIFFKNLALVGIVNINLWMWEVLEAEEQAAQLGLPAEQPPFPDLDPIFTKAVVSGSRELATVTVRRMYEHLAAARLPPRLAWKLLKDYRVSINRKADFYSGINGFYLLPAYATTIGRATALMFAADCTVTAAVAGYSTAAAAARIEPGPAKRERVRKLAAAAAARVSRQAARCVLVWALSAASAAAVAALFAPRARAGQWASISHFLFDTLYSNLLVLVLEGGLGDLAGLLPPGLLGGGGGSGGGGGEQQQRAEGQPGQAGQQPPAQQQWRPPAHIVLPAGLNPGA